MRRLEDRAARRLVDAGDFMPTKRFSTRSRRPTPCFPPSSFKRCSRPAGRKLLAVDADRVAALECDLDIFGHVGCRLGCDGTAEDELFRLDPRVFQHLASRGDMQQVGVDRERGLAALVLGDRDLVLFGVVEEPGARGQIPLAPRCDDLDVGSQCVIAKLETDLVVAFAGSAD